MDHSSWFFIVVNIYTFEPDHYCVKLGASAMIHELSTMN